MHEYRNSLGLFLLCATAVSAQRFYPDDPLWKEPPPRNVDKVPPQRLNALVDFYKNSVHEKGERNTAQHVFPSKGVNTLGEVPDSVWFTNRHDRLRPMTREELARGPNVDAPPKAGQPYTIVSAKVEGVSPGFSITDGTGRRFFVKFDPPSNPELATAADVICAKFFHAIGYNTPENFIFMFAPEELAIKEGLKFEDTFGRFRPLQPRDVSDLLRLVARERQGRIRAVASLRLAGEGVGGFKYYKWRKEDPNEIAPHEHLRVLRGLFVFAAWLNHTDAKSLNTFDAVVKENGNTYVRHYLLDFGSALGSDALYAKDPRLGHEYMLDVKSSVKYLATGGVYVPKYARVHYPDDPAVGNISAEAFDPDRWKSNYPNAAFESRLPGDEYWAAKKVMAFRDDDIRAIVATGGFSDPNSAETLSKILIARRDAIGRTFFAKLLPLDNFRVEGDALAFDDLALLYGFHPRRDYTFNWARFDNETGATTPIPGGGPQLPPTLTSGPRGSFFAVTISASDFDKCVTAYFRRGEAWQLVGIDREGGDAWEEK